MTECHLRNCITPSLIRQIGLGLAAGALCFLVLSYADPAARKSEPEAAVEVPTPAEPLSSAPRASGAAATSSQPDEASLPLPALTAGGGSDGVQGEGMADEVIPTPMLGEPSAAVSIAADEKVVAQPPMLITAGAPPSAAQPAAKPSVSPESVSKPEIKPEAKPQGKAPGKVSLTPAKVLQQKNGNHLSVQLMGSGSLAAIEQFVLANRLAGKVWIYQTKFHGRPWYVVLKGEHASMSQALAAIRKLPPALQKAGPWPKSFAQVKNELKQ
ncbi:SPOR domain-containing protein [Aeromonas encheleia]|uniref:SPOR domain-containing protein n=1 Tax=Aeromonas encheleia TaxID=73010 RepID=A0AAE9MDQ3_9GAMM|nr:SPOR domain-containing protein [Aeromonas encheleia]USV56584.1 hypothetical protein NHF51_14670 [Aeromonas encheleia]